MAAGAYFETKVEDVPIDKGTGRMWDSLESIFVKT